MSRSLVESSRYSPGNMSAEALEALFVGRAQVLATILKRLAASAKGKEKHYFLLVGPRGSGKTHFVALACSKLLSSEMYSDIRQNIAIAYLREEEWGVASYLDFLLRVLQSMAAGNSSAMADVGKIFNLFEKDADEAHRYAENLLRTLVGGKTLILICENLADLFEGIGESGQKRWRAYIQENPFWSILATTPAMFAGVQLRQSPFYGFFAVRELRPLTLDAAVELLVKKALHEGKAELASLLQTPIGRARVRAIHHLAGGNHRVYVTLYEFLDKHSLDELVTPFMRMVDDLTPYYQDRMRQLAPAQRKIVEYLAQATTPVNVKDIALKCLMSQQTAAKQLLELGKLGVISRTGLGRKTFCELAEPLMRICIEVKDNRTEHLQLFVELLRHWFSWRELELRKQELERFATKDHAVDKLHLEEALYRFREDHREPFLEALDEEARQCLDSDDYIGLHEAAARLVTEKGKEGHFSLCCYAARRMHKPALALETAEAGLNAYPESRKMRFEKVRALADLNRSQEAIVLLEQCLTKAPNYIAYLCFRGGLLLDLGRYQDAASNETKLLEVDPSHHHAYAQRARAFLQMHKFKEAISDAKILIRKDPKYPGAWSLWARGLHGLGRIKQAFKVWKHAMYRFPRDPGLHFELGEILRKNDELQGAAREFKRAIELKAGPPGFCRLGSTLRELGQYEEALKVCETLAKLEPNHWHVYLDIADCYVKIGNAAKAKDTLDIYLHALGVDERFLIAAGTLLARAVSGESELAMRRRTTDCYPVSSTAWLMRARGEMRHKRLEEAAYSLAQAKKYGAHGTVTDLQEWQLRAMMEGLQTVSKDLVRFFRAESKSTDLDVAQTIANVLIYELEAHGVGGVSNAAKLIAEVVPTRSRTVLGGAIIRIIYDHFEILSTNLGSFTQALTSVWGGFRSCTLPLLVLEVAKDYSVNRDPEVLFKLPLELRQLVSARLGFETTNRADMQREPKSV